MSTKNGIRCLPFSEWPELDQATWICQCRPGDPFDDLVYAATLRPVTLASISQSYGRWLSFLASRGWLDPQQSPLLRVTRRRLRSYFHDLRAAGNLDWTIIERFSGLARAMKILAPGQDVGWIRRPDGVTIYALLSRRQRPMLVPDSGVLFRWAIDMMDTTTTPMQYQNGLLLALLAARGRRLRSMTLLRVGQELVQDGERYWIELVNPQVKTDKPDRFPLPAELTPYLQHYLAAIRPVLLQDQTHDALWVDRFGLPWLANRIYRTVKALTLQRFGVAFGPHRFRHAIATTAILRDPGSPGLAAGVLGSSAQVIEQHYERAGQSQAMIMFDQAMARRQGRLRRLAERSNRS